MKRRSTWPVIATTGDESRYGGEPRDEVGGAGAAVESHADAPEARA